MLSCTALGGQHTPGSLLDHERSTSGAPGASGCDGLTDQNPTESPAVHRRARRPSPRRARRSTHHTRPSPRLSSQFTIKKLHRTTHILSPPPPFLFSPPPSPLSLVPSSLFPSPLSPLYSPPVGSKYLVKPQRTRLFIFSVIRTHQQPGASPPAS